VKHAVLGALVLIAACGSGNDSTSSTRLVVFAASSLTQAFTDIGKAYEQSHRGTTVTFSFAGSQSLVAQIRQGAPADVLATADTGSMAAAGLSDARVIARNRLAVITAPGNPKGVHTLADLGRPGLRVVLAGPTVPAGKAATKALADARVGVRPRSLESDVKGVVTKVRLGEADAGIAYATDLRSAGGAVDGTPLTPISNSYPIAVVRPGSEASAFVTFVLSPAGQAVLASFGFLPP
jgi:molybdate transport system substrate-binding protein